jgi:hypothetical protein
VYVYNKKQKTVCLENDNVCYTFSSVSEVLKFFNMTKSTFNYKRKKSNIVNGFKVYKLNTFCNISNCSKCNNILTKENAVAGKGDFCVICKACKNKQYYENRENILKKQKIWYEKNKQIQSVKLKKRYEKNREFYLERSKNYRKAHPVNKFLHAKNQNKRRFLKLTSFKAFIAYSDEIKLIYKKSHELSIETGIKHHVDHIVPLQGKNVCGLHVPWNLQILTATENLRKSNKFQGGLP